MATKWYNSEPSVRQREQERKALRCEPCKNGRHLERGCIGRGCGCFCRGPSVPASRFQSVEISFPADMANVLRLLRERDYQCRGTRGFKLLWNPKPEEMEVAVRMAIRSHKLELVHILFPWNDWRGPLRPFWTVGRSGQCIDDTCDPSARSSCYRYDPLGQCRHSSCGWLAGPPDYARIGGYVAP